MVQRSGCSQPAKRQNNHQTAIFQPDRCQGATAGNASGAGSQQSQSPSQTSPQSPMHFAYRWPTLIPTTKASQTALRSPLQHWVLIARESATKFPSCFLRQKRTKPITKAALECWQWWKSKVAIPRTLYPLARQDSVRKHNYWSLAMLCSAHIALQFCPGCLQKLRGFLTTFTSSFLSLCAVLIVNALLF